MSLGDSRITLTYDVICSSYDKLKKRNTEITERLLYHVSTVVMGA